MNKFKGPEVMVVVDREYAADGNGEAVWVEYRDADGPEALVEVRVHPLLLGSDTDAAAQFAKVKAELRHIADNLEALTARANETHDLEVATMDRLHKDIRSLLRRSGLQKGDMTEVLESIDVDQLQ